MPFSFESLNVYQRSVDLLEELNALLGNLGESENGESFFYEELRRSALLIPTQLANGNSKWHREDKKDCFRNSRAAAFRCVPILELMCRTGTLKGDQVEKLRDDIDGISRMITGLIVSLDKKRKEEDPDEADKE
jgi:four helix bundle protein